MDANGPFDSDGDPADPGPADPPTVMVPERRQGVFAVIHADGRHCTLGLSRLRADGSFQHLPQERHVFNPGVPTAANPRGIAVRLADILTRYQRLAELNGAAVRAVATQAFRALPNHEQMLIRLRRVTRVALDLISDRDAARFVCLGALGGRKTDRPSLVVDVGEDAAAIILANGDEPLALFRAGLGLSRFREAPKSGTPEPDGIRIQSWRRQIQQTLATGQLETIRGVAGEAVLVRRRDVAPAATTHLAAVTVLDEVASYLEIRRVQSTESGLEEGILLDLSRTVPPQRAPPPSTQSPARTPRTRSDY